jgi:tetratricopeptide (TPR) repeat protein
VPSIERLEKMLAADPEDTFVLYAIAQEHAKAGDHDRAVAFYDRCLAVDAAYCYAYYHKAKSLEELGREADAVATLRTGLEAAKGAGDGKALGEIAGYLDALT